MQPLATLFVMDPLEVINVDGDSTFVLMLEAQKRGWPVWFTSPDEVYADGGMARARAQTVRCARTAPHFETGPVQDVALGDFDVVWMRKDPPYNTAYLFCTYLLDLTPATTLVLNNPDALRSCNEKLYALRWPELCPATFVTRHVEQAVAWIENRGARAVIKPWDGCGGFGVVVTEPGDGNLRSMLEVLTNRQQDFVLVQQYIPEIVDGDKRIILVDGEPVGAMLRIPQPGDHRGNMHVGARVEAVSLSERDLEICGALEGRLRLDDLLFVGIDVIGTYLTEINVTSPTGIQEINALCGLSLEQTVTDAVEGRVRRLRAELGLS